jgi:hypothetical protein
MAVVQRRPARGLVLHSNARRRLLACRVWRLERAGAHRILAATYPRDAPCE